jgi:hypothetical protein
MKSLFFCVIILILFSTRGEDVLAGGMGVNMGIELLQQVPLGEKYLIRPTLIIYNKSDKANTFVLSPLKSSIGLGIGFGYSALPEIDWLSFEKNEIKIPPNSQDSVRVYLSIPKEQRYYNQHWSVYISVASGAGGGNISLACYPKILVETQSQQSPSEKNDALLGLEPIVIKFENVQPGQPSSERKVKIYNNSDKKRTYRISVLGSETRLERRIFLTPGYNWIPDSSWIKLYSGKLSSSKSTPFRINVGANKSFSLKLEVNLPEDKQSKKWEGIILVESDQGLSNFVRVYIEP